MEKIGRGQADRQIGRLSRLYVGRPEGRLQTSREVVNRHDDRISRQKDADREV